MALEYLGILEYLLEWNACVYSLKWTHRVWVGSRLL